MSTIIVVIDYINGQRIQQNLTVDVEGSFISTATYDPHRAVIRIQVVGIYYPGGDNTGTPVVVQVREGDN